VELLAIFLASQPSKESIALSAQLESILDAFLSPPKRFQLMEILHVTSALGGDPSKIIKLYNLMLLYYIFLFKT
jgi:hypothetical protein